MGKIVECEVKRATEGVNASLYEALQHRMKTDNASLDHVVTAALSRCMGKPIHTLLQVSTSAALVEGLYQGQCESRACFATEISAGMLASMILMGFTPLDKLCPKAGRLQTVLFA